MTVNGARSSLVSTSVLAAVSGRAPAQGWRVSMVGAFPAASSWPTEPAFANRR
jgi:hypothetical protein